MRLGVGIFLGYLLVAALAVYFVQNVFLDEIKPSASQAMEDSLVDASNLLAELSAEDFYRGTLQGSLFATKIKAYEDRILKASIWGTLRSKPGFRIYMTDLSGRVIYDSTGEALGQDYSRWNDVYLTLKGEYGARNSPDIEGIDLKKTMYVAAPILREGKIIGSLTVAKSNLALAPFIARAEEKILRTGTWLLLAGLLMGLMISLWFSKAIQNLVHYAETVTKGERVVLKRSSIKELQKLGASLESMREKLEGKRYVEDYIGTLTHEMKSPLTAILAASELLREPLPEDARDTFLLSIADQTKRLNSLIHKMLDQSKLENLQTLENREDIDLVEIIHEALQSVDLKRERKSITLEKMYSQTPVRVTGDAFLLHQALVNLLDNAIDFSPVQGKITLTLKTEKNLCQLFLEDEGPGVPAYARERIFERYYSLPRPDGSPKSTGIGLPFVRQVLALHKGTIELVDGRNEDRGARFCLILPIQK